MKNKKSIFYLIVILFLFSFNLFANGSVRGSRLLSVGKLWHVDEDGGSGGWHMGYSWPGGRMRRNGPELKHANATVRMCGLSMAHTNYQRGSSNYYPFAVSTVTGSVIANTHSTNLDESFAYGGYIKTTMRRKPPVVIVDGEVDSSRHQYDEIDPNLICDQKLSLKFAMKNGVTVTQDYYAYAGENADSYMIVDFHLTNDGQIDDDSRVELRNQHLTDVYINYGVLQHIGLEGAEQNANTIETNTDDWVEYYGENYLDYLGSGNPLNPIGDSNADSLRMYIVWDGNSSTDIHGALDDVGDPNLNKVWDGERPPLGTILSPQYFGMGILHADMSVSDETNDLSQPVTTSWYPHNKGQNEINDIKSYKLFFEGDGSVIGEDWQHHRPSPQELGFTDPSDVSTVCRPNPYMAIGPYDMPFGSDIHFTMLVAVNGLSEKECVKYGTGWYNKSYLGESEGYTDNEKNEMVATGRDSLMKYFNIATKRYFRNIELGKDPFDVPDPPPAPNVNIQKGVNQVSISWSDVSSELDIDTYVNDFAGYKVYRAKGAVDSTYHLIWQCGGNTGISVDTSIVDYSVSAGVPYFYYVAAYDDGTQNWENPGVSLESGKFLNLPLMHSVEPTIRLPTSLDSVAVVPNPYHWRGGNKRRLPFRKNHIMFVNVIPGDKISVYTVSGDLVRTFTADRTNTVMPLYNKQNELLSYSKSFR